MERGRGKYLTPTDTDSHPFIDFDMKYIDADRLREELQKPKTELKVGNYYLDNSEQAVGYENALIDFELLIDSLQQEQPEVDLDGLINDFLLNNSKFLIESDSKTVVQKLARHFYELGKLNARKKE